MADAPWVHVVAYDPEIQGLTEACVAEANLSVIHPYVPPAPGDWKAQLGIQTEIHLVNGSLLYTTATFQQLKDAIKAKPV